MMTSHSNIYPLSYGQQGIWLHQQQAPHTVTYNTGLAMRILSQVNPVALRQTFQTIIERQPVLRTIIYLKDGQPVQQILDGESVAFTHIDATGWDEERLRAEVMQTHRHPYDLTQGPLFRVHLFTQSPFLHVLLIGAHHLVMDAASLWYLLDEISLLYPAALAGNVPQLPVLERTYADYVMHEKEILQRKGKKLWAFWQSRLADVPLQLELPTDYRRPLVQEFSGRSEYFTLSCELTSALNALAKQEKSTLYVLLLGSFQILLHRYSQQKRFIVGTPTDSQPTPAFRATVGNLINMLPLCADLSDNPMLKDFFRQVWKTMIMGLRNQAYPFSLLVQKLNIPHDSSISPVVQVLFNFPQPKPEMAAFLITVPGEEESIQSQEWAGLSVAPFGLPQQEGGGDLYLEIVQGTEKCFCVLKYNPDLFHLETIERMIGHFQTLLAEIVANPEQRVTQVPILTEAERHQILVEWTDTTTDYPKERCVHQLFEDQVERTPDAMALVFKDSQLTYRELNSRANQLAHYLMTQGVGPDMLVGLFVERSLEMVIAILAIFKAGAAYLALAPAYPRDRLEFMIRDAQVSHLLTTDALWHDLPNNSVTQVICFEREQDAIISQSRHNLTAREVRPNNLAYVIYTSGSTGKPKGVLVEHRSLANAYFAWEDVYRLRTESRSHLQLASFSFDVFVGDLVRALCSGAKLVICPREILLQPEKLYNLMRQEQIQCAEFVPAVFRQLAKYLQESQQTLHFMRLLIVASDQWYINEYQAYQQLCGPQTRLINSYGVSEATIDSTYFEKSDRPMPDNGVVPIGKPFPNTQLYILDQDLQAQPVGLSGELHIGGAGLARGYKGRPQLTEEKFINNPFGAGKLYKTGDLARYLPASRGNIEFLGRIDHQVKLRGFRIELGEIESALRASPNVREAVVLAREDNAVRGDKRLVAYIVGDADSDTLRQQLAQCLPDYMIPAAFVPLKTMPLSPNGKIDRRALPEPSYADAQTHYVPPRHALEQQLADIWADILGVEQIGIHDNFFALGGHSLLAIQVVSQVRAQLNLEVPLATLFSSSQLATFADVISQAQTSTTTAIRKAERDRPLPLSFAQQRLWFLDQLEPNSAFYNIPTVIRLAGQLDLLALEQSFSYLIGRHESLRTTFGAADGEPMQVIHEPEPFILKVIVVDGEEQAQQLALAEASTPFDLRQGPLLRVQLLKYASSNPQTPRGHRHLLLLTMHHIISDAWSTGVLIEELTHAYAAYAPRGGVQGNVPTLPQLPIEYADFAVWQREILAGETSSRQLSFWRQQLMGAPALLELPTDRPRPPLLSYRGAHYTFQLDGDLTAKLKQLAQSHDATLFMVVLAAFNVLLSRYSRQTDIVVGTPIANRNRAEIEGLIGFFVNTLAIRTQLDDKPSFAELLQKVRQTTLAAYEHQDLPFEQLVDELQPQRSLSYTPLFQVMLVLENREMRSFALPDPVSRETSLSATMGLTELPFAKFDLTLFLLPSDEGLGASQGLRGMLEYSTDLFDEATIARMANHFELLLNGIVEEPDQPVLQLPLLTDTEYHQIVHESNDTAVDFGEPQTIHALFEAQVERTPDAIALVFNDQELTYAELNARANQLAHHLIELGVQPDTLVAVAMERSLEMVMTLLAVLKAGGAYVPIDPTYPRERIRYMLTDCAAPILLTQFHLELDDAAEHVVILDRVGEQLAFRLTENLETSSKPEDLAYVIYTSGSTGQPKGVMIQHSQVLAMLSAYEQLAPSKEQMCGTSVCSYNFDVSVWEFFSQLCFGGTLHLLTISTLSVESLVNYLCTHGITSAYLPPMLLAEMAFTYERTEAPITLGRILVGVEPIPQKVLQRFRDLSPSLSIINGYGPTECTICSSFYEFNVAVEPERRTPIGKPLANYQIYLCDANLQPVPIGVSGEILIGGAGVGRGYLNRPELTARAYIEHPQFGRLYKTGDLCRWLPDGNIEFMGRTDFQVKVRGFRIELGEIESALLAQDGVREAVVLAREDKPGDKRLVGYIVGDANSDTLRQQLAPRLPEYMVPSAFVQLSAMPLTPNGKLDRRALPAPNYFEALTHYVAPRNALEQQLADIWADVLGIEQVGIHDNFFALGGHSLLATQVISRIRRQLNVALPLKKLFNTSNLAELAALVSALNTARKRLQGKGRGRSKGRTRGVL